ncbi:hypothetical protein BU26DRAFT_568459 [Trematosphaeria pertusa]|uniref:Uncharacterized protein n=1 Tax=Trematosphaeria pertusa TaxID=390896 RepID=A0A6A6I479_9PLEO|nr:uncharacterized protein BU26DRAFT_568459 [Trematosphaeria pertusa]KAF2245161.1 hypothetical protein BU26DRAFT_568459 [Trematosphaeria pertusa]
MWLLDYTQAPSIGLYFLVSQIATLRRPMLFDVTKCRVSAGLILLTLLHVVDTLRYLYRVLVIKDAPAQDYEIHLFSSIMVTAHLQLNLHKARSPLWYPYLGAFVMGAGFEGIRCMISVRDLAVHHGGATRPMLSFLKVSTSATLSIL